MEKIIEIPEGYEARIEGNKVVLDPKGSEDERIRKELIEYLTHRAEVTGFIDEDKDCKRWIAYLEKQKEQKPLMCDGEIEDKKRDIVAAIRKYYPADYAEYLTSFLKNLSPEDNSEDEYGQGMLGIAYKLMYEHIPENLRTQEFWDSLKFMREYTGKVAIIHSYERPTEWGEEDETFVKDAIEAVENYYSKGCGQEELVAWLKSLHPQQKQEWSEDDEKVYNKALDALYYKDCNDKEDVLNALKDLCDLISEKRKVVPPYARWKPSEEQIELLEQSVRLSADKPAIHGVILSLYNDLKELM